MRIFLNNYTRAVTVTVALFASAAASAQQDLEVTMDVVPANAAADAATREIKLPPQASPTAQDNAAFGLDTANQARGLRDGVGSDFGRSVSDAARERARSNDSSGKSKK